MRNLAIDFLEEVGESLLDYDGICGELVDALIHWLGEDRVRILYIKPESEWHPIESEHDHFGWKYHMVAVVDGFVHDAWFPELVLPPDEYVLSAFPGQDLHCEITGLRDGK